MIAKLFHVLLTDNNILFFDEDSGNVTFSSDELGILRLNLNINLDDTKLYEDDPKSIFSWLGTINLSSAKHLKRNKQRINACSLESNKMVQLMHARRREKRNRIIFTDVEQYQFAQFLNNFMV